jgi:hypothetical protein
VGLLENAQKTEKDAFLRHLKLNARVHRFSMAQLRVPNRHSLLGPLTLKYANSRSGTRASILTWHALIEFLQPDPGNRHGAPSHNWSN